MMQPGLALFFPLELRRYQENDAYGTLVSVVLVVLLIADRDSPNSNRASLTRSQAISA